jgi:hypothetical protein
LYTVKYSSDAGIRLIGFVVVMLVAGQAGRIDDASEEKEIGRCKLSMTSLGRKYPASCVCKMKTRKIRLPKQVVCILHLLFYNMDWSGEAEKSEEGLA